MALFCGWLVWRIGWHSAVEDLKLFPYWFWLAFTLLLAPYVVNIGFGVRWGAWPRVAALVILGGAAVLGYWTTGAWLSRPLWLTINGLMLYVWGHLAGSFLLSALLATPGCEMRAVPHLFGILTRRPREEHYCPGFLDAVDRWERGEVSGKEPPGDRRSEPLGLLAGVPGMLLFYGLPYLAILLSGNLGGPVSITVVWTVAFAVMGIVGLVDALRSSRVHCFFTAPWFLLAASATLLLHWERISLGQRSWSTLANTALFGAVALYCLTEKLWGRYFRRGVGRSMPEAR